MQIDRFDQFVTLNDSSSVQLLFLYPIAIKRVVLAALRKGELGKNTAKHVTIKYSEDSR